MTTMTSNIGFLNFIIVVSIVLLVVVIILAVLLIHQRRKLNSLIEQQEGLKAQASTEKQMLDQKIEEYAKRLAYYEENEKILQAAYSQLYKPYSQLTHQMSERSFSADLKLLHEQLLTNGILMMDILPVVCRDANISSSNRKNVEFLLVNNSDLRRREVNQSPSVTTNTFETSLEAIALNRILIQNGMTTFEWLLDGCKYTVE